MKLIQALETVNRQWDADAPGRHFFLACSFTPLHLLTFLRAYLRLRFPSARTEVNTGLYGDLPGNLVRLEEMEPGAAAVVVEWSDLDPRLGMRQLGGWGLAAISDAVATVNANLQRLEREIRRVAESRDLALSVPTLPLPPCFLGPGWIESTEEADLRSSVASFARRLIEIPRVRVLNQQRLQQLSPAGERYDPRSDLQNGFPYQQSHADVLASLLAALMVETPLCKGIITDLDDTLWRGILGELGPQGVTWDMAEHAQIHGVYQQFLDAMAERGALIGVASKNDAGLVEDALNRPDLHIRRERLFPVEAGWGRKSESVSRILHTWNVGADAVIFVDDNPAEVAEVEFRHPQIKGRHFRGEDPQAVLALLSELRDCFGKRVVTAEDGIRSASLRSNQALQERASDTGSWEAFLQQMDARIQISFQDGPSDTRAFELINKTNQFNLNGRRFTPGEWQARLAGNNAVLATVSYHDKFGPLGKIAVLLGAADPARAVVRIETWVMSCRAFSRRIEYQCLRQLFERFQAKEIVLDFMPTPRNAPARDFIAKFGEPCAEFRITREQFERNCPPLYHSCQEVAAIG